MSTKFMRKVELKNGEYYHIYNRGVDKRDVFLDECDYVRFLVSMHEFNAADPIGSLFEKDLREKREAVKGSSTPFGPGVELPGERLVEIIAYCLNPNHYHFILKQIHDKGIEKFMQKLGTGYTNYFNKRQKRSGSLFQGKFKSVHIDSNEYLLYLSAYVNKNNFIHGYTDDSSEWKYASMLDYLGKRDGKLCNKDAILVQFDNNFEHYSEFMDVHALRFKENKEMSKYTLE